MREISTAVITDTVARLFQEANYHLPEDVVAALRRARQTEPSPVGQEVLDQLLENAEIAARGQFPLCQDTGFSVVFVEVGQDVHIVGGDVTEAINEGIRRGYKDGFLRKSIVRQPFSSRQNTKDNTPGAIHYDLVPGDQIKITVLPKGGGCENMSYLSMMPPSAGREGVIKFVVDCVDKSGSNPCPPIIVGVGVGGTSDVAMAIAKKALLRPLGQPNPDPEVAALEQEIFQRIKDLGIGPMGLGGETTALGVHIETFPAHLASMPVGVNIQCHSARVKSAIL